MSRHLPRPAGLALAALCGAAMAGQARVNGELGHRMHDPVGAAVISFGVGLALLAVIVPALPAGRRGVAGILTALRAGSLRPWQCLGGACGAWYVACQGMTVATLGVAVFSVAIICGQLGSGLIVDRLGIGPGAAQPFTVRRILGSGLAVAAVAVAVADRLGTPAGLGFAALVVVAGAGSAWQQAVNGRVREAAGNALPAALVNFVVGTVGLLAVFGVFVAVRGLPSAPPAVPWLYIGGPLGIVFIAIAATVVRSTGVLLFGLGSVAGQLVGAIVLDAVLPTAGRELAVNTVLGVGLALVAVVIAAAAGRRGRGA